MKFAQIGYGHDGRGTGTTNGQGYTYLVSDNVRKNQVMQVIATSRNKRVFPTTGQVLTTHAKQPKDANGNPITLPMKDNVQMTEKDLTPAYTNKELGVKNGFGTTKEQRTAQARYNALLVYNQEALGGLTGEAAEKKLAITGGTKTEKLMDEGYESYAAYIERTKPWGDDK